MVTLVLVLSGCGSGEAGDGRAPGPVSPPPQPTGLTAEAGDGEVQLSWTAIMAAIRWDYRQRVGDGTWGAWTRVPGSGSGTTGHTVADLENGTTYGFQVRAVNAGGEGPASVEATATPVTPAVPVEIPDENLRRVLERALGKAPGETITDVDLRTLSDLGAKREGIVDLTGLEHATGLEWADLSHNSLVDLTPLEALASLEHLDLSENRISDLRPLAGLTSLEHLGLSYNDVVDLQPLSDLEALTRLELGPEGIGRGGESSNRVADPSPLTRLELGQEGIGDRRESSNRVADLSPLSGLVSLTHLELSFNAVTDISPLAGVASLEHLGLTYNDVSDLTPLSGLGSLTQLELGGNRVSDLTSLSGLVSLTHVELWRNLVADLSPLGGLTSLEHLGLAVNAVVDVRPLAELTSLTYLRLHDNYIVHISALGGLQSLEDLTLGRNLVSKVEPLATLTSLRRLNLANLWAVEDLSFVSGMEDLEELDLTGTSISDLRPLAALGKLERLAISETAIDDLSPLESLASLRRLSMAGLSVDLEPLAELTSLEEIWQTGFPTDDEMLPKVDIAPLAGLRNLGELVASPSQGDLSPLAGLASLQRLHLHQPGTPFENLQALEGLPLLRYVRMIGGGLEGIPPLAESAEPYTLYVNGNRIEDLSPLAGLESLLVLSLDNNRVRDIAPLVENPRLGAGDTISLVGNPLGADALRTHIPELESRGATVARDRDDFPDSPLRVLRDEAVSMRVDADLDTVSWDLDLVTYTKEFLAHFGDGFDVLLFVSALPFLSYHADLRYIGVYWQVSNEVDGIGLDPFERPSYGSTRLKGVIHFPYLRALAHGPSLHELMHIWANFGVETSAGAHWGFSSAEGQLGGFRLENLVDLGGGLWSAGTFGSIGSGGNRVPYSPWELYLGGFVGPDEVPDLWNAPEGRWTGDRTEAGHSIFEAAERSTLTVEEFVETHGPRDPDHASAPKELRGAVIVLEDDDYQLHHWNLLLEQVRWLSYPGRSAAFQQLYNYHEATGGRGRLVLDRLVELRRETPLSAISELRLIQVCPAPGMPAAIGAAALTSPDVRVRESPSRRR